MAALDRFVEAQSRDYPSVVAELQRGSKRSHWIWYIFPQVAGLGRSETARFYAISTLSEAEAYLAHPLLGARLRECVQLMLGWQPERSAATILGELDAMKLRSSLTLFEAAGGGALFGRAIDGFFEGRRDENTLRIVGLTPPRTK